MHLKGLSSFLGKKGGRPSVAVGHFKASADRRASDPAAHYNLGTALTQVVTRSLVWWVAVPQDLLKGDSIDVVYETRADQEPLVHAVRFTSRAKRTRASHASSARPSGSGTEIHSARSLASQRHPRPSDDIASATSSTRTCACSRT